MPSFCDCWIDAARQEPLRSCRTCRYMRSLSLGWLSGAQSRASSDTSAPKRIWLGWRASRTQHDRVNMIGSCSEYCVPSMATLVNIIGVLGVAAYGTPDDPDMAWAHTLPCAVQGVQRRYCVRVGALHFHADLSGSKASRQDDFLWPSCPLSLHARALPGVLEFIRGKHFKAGLQAARTYRACSTCTERRHSMRPPWRCRMRPSVPAWRIPKFKKFWKLPCKRRAPARAGGAEGLQLKISQVPQSIAASCGSSCHCGWREAGRA